VSNFARKMRRKERTVELVTGGNPATPAPLNALVIIGMGQDGELSFQSKLDPATTFLIVAKALEKIRDGIEVGAGANSKIITASGAGAEKLRVQG